MNPQTRRAVWPDTYKLLLIIIILTGAALRFHGLFWDQPYFFNPDESRLIEWGKEFDYLNPIASEWGTLPLLAVRLMSSLLGLFGQTSILEHYFYARVLSALLGCITLALVYALAKRAYSKATALLAAAFSAFTVLLIQDSHFYSLDGLFAALVLLSLLPIISIARKGRTRDYILAGLAIGLTVATRVNGILLAAPLLTAHCYAARSQPGKFITRCFFGKNFWLAAMLSAVVFVALTPLLLLNPYKFLFHDGLAWVFLQSSGFIKFRYTLQFEGTTPGFYFSNLLFWAAGPLLLVSYLVGVIFAAVKWRHRENLVILTFVVLYVWTGMGARVKFIRYVLPVLPLLNIIAASFFVSVLKLARRRPMLKWSVAGGLAVVLLGTVLYALAFTNIYSMPDPRIVAGKWIQANIPAGAKIARGSNDIRGGLLEFEGENSPEYQLRKINFDRMYESSPVAGESQIPSIFEAWGIEISRRGKDNNFEPGTMSDDEKRRHIGEQIYCADYIIFTERNYALYKDRPELFPVENEYFTKLFNGKLGYQLVKTFARKPGLLSWQIDDSDAELTFHLFDHPTVWIFQAQPSPEFVVANPPQIQTEANWDNKISLPGFDVTSTSVAAGQSVQLTLYWEVLSRMAQNYTIFVHLQNSAGDMAAQSDHQVADGVLPTSCWIPGRVVADKITLPVSADAAAGSYQLKVGLYSPDTLQRLPLINDATGENALQLATVQILPAP